MDFSKLSKALQEAKDAIKGNHCSVPDCEVCADISVVLKKILELQHVVELFDRRWENKISR